MKYAHTALLGIGLLLSACGSAPTEHYYTLLGTPPVGRVGDAVAAAGPTPAITIASVTLPEAVERSELVVRSGSNSVTVMETQRWAESLKSAVPRAIAGDLSRLLDGATVSVQADNASRDAKYLVYIDITRFDSVLNEAVSVDAIWSVRLAGGEQIKAGRSSLRVPVASGGFEQLVAAHAQALGELSGEMATQIKTIKMAGK
jgi:uncharacterized lipoprotein YmbA